MVHGLGYSLGPPPPLLKCFWYYGPECANVWQKNWLWFCFWPLTLALASALALYSAEGGTSKTLKGEGGWSGGVSPDLHKENVSGIRVGWWSAGFRQLGIR